jgi:protein O-GlcNAc transferase
MPTPNELALLAIGKLQAGELAQAEQLCQQILTIDPTAATAWQILGLAAQQAGNNELATARFERCIELRPDLAAARYNLGNVLRGQGALNEAIGCYTRALELKPDFVEACNNLAIALQSQGKPAEAEHAYRRALEIRPGFAAAYNGLGTLYFQQNRMDDAAACFRRAIELEPRLVDALSNLGQLLNTQEKFTEAAALLQKAVECAPASPAAHNNLGNALKGLGQLAAAAACYRMALELTPGNFNAHANLGSLLQDQDDLDGAVEHYQAAEAIAQRLPVTAPQLADVWNNLGTVLKDRGQIDDALFCFRQAISFAPNHLTAHSNLLYSLSFSPEYDPEEILIEHRRFDEQHARPLTALALPHANARDPNRRLRIGYVSPDFRHHCQSYFTTPLFAAHDRQQFEIYCYSDVPRNDAVTEHLAAHVDAWSDIFQLSDERAAALIRQDQIDILVDLTMHMAHGRPLLFARKPAPVQVAWLAYPGTTGLTAMDFRLTDPHLDPPGMFDHYYSEQSIRLPDSFWCYRPLVSDVPVNALSALSNGYVTFGCLNNFSKINPAVLSLWAGALRSVDHSRLLLLAPLGLARQKTAEFLAQQGIDPARITFVSRKPLADYLRLYHQLDICLDTLPANGHTTTLDSLWMGVPVVTLAGHTAIGRGALSQLTNLGLPGLIANTPAEFARVASEQASDLTRLSQLRSALRGRMQASPLMDAPRFARNIEIAFRQMWQNWCYSQGFNGVRPME